MIRDSTKENAHERAQKCVQNFGQKLEGRDHLEDADNIKMNTYLLPRKPGGIEIKWDASAAGLCR
jgi:hypothetical protein